MVNNEAKSTVVSALLVFTTFALGFAEFVLIGIVPDVAEGLSVDLTQVGAVVSCYALACAVGTPVLAMLTGDMSRKRLFAALLVVFNLGNLITVFAPSYPVLLASRMLPAVAGGTLMALCMTYVPEVASRKRVALVMSLVLAGYSVSSVVGVPIGTLVANALGWQAAYAVVLVCGLAASVALYPFLPGDAPAAGGFSIGSHLRLLRDGRILLNIAMMVCVAGSTYVFYTYLTPVLEDVMGFDVGAISLILGVFGAACVASNLISGWIAGRFGLKGLPPTFAIHAVLLALLAATIPMGAPGVVNILLVGLVMYAMNSTAQLLYQDVARDDYPDALTFSASLHPMAFNAGIALGSALGGVVVDTLGMLATGPVGGAMAAAGALLAVALCRAASPTR